MQADVFVGHYCPTCNSSIGMVTAIGGLPPCPGCGGPLQAAVGGPRTTSIANASCQCGVQIGLLTVVGGEAVCPRCSRPFS